MRFDVPAQAYDRFMGRYSSQLSAQLADLAAVGAGDRVLDVGCGPGALTRELAARVGAGSVAAVDPSDSFVEAARHRLPGVDVRQAHAESLPFADDAFDAALAQLVVHFMGDPVAGLTEMARVTRPGGTVAASVWAYDTDQNPLGAFWAIVRRLDPHARDEAFLAGARHGHLDGLFDAAGLRDVRRVIQSATLEHPTFQDWWEPFELGVGPAGKYVGALEPGRRAELRAACREALGDGPITIVANAYACRGMVAG